MTLLLVSESSFRQNQWLTLSKVQLSSAFKITRYKDRSDIKTTL